MTNGCFKRCSIKSKKMYALAVCLFALQFAAACGTQPQTSQQTANSSASPPPAARRTYTPLSDYKVEWVNHMIPTEMRAGAPHVVTVTVRNAGTSTWPSKGEPDNPKANLVTVSYHWLPAQGDRPVVFDGARTLFSRDIGAGEAVTLNNVQVIGPPTAGSYRLQLSLVHELVAWFENKGAQTLTVPVTVR